MGGAVLCESCGILRLAEKLPHVCPTQTTTRLLGAYGRPSRGGQNLTPGVSLRPQTTGTGHLMQDCRVRECDGVSLAVPTKTGASGIYLLSRSRFRKVCIPHCCEKDMAVIFIFTRARLSLLSTTLGGFDQES